MIECEISDDRAEFLDQLVELGIFSSPGAASNYATDSFSWIDLFNAQRRPMISAAGVYRAGKSDFDEVLQSLRRGFDKSWLVSSTGIIYGDNLSGIVTQNHGSRVVEPSQKDVSVIPIYDGTPLAKALQTEEGISCLQAVLDTNDGPEIIAETLENLSGRGAKEIGLWTPDQDSRKRHPERAVGFYDDGDMFRVYGDRIYSTENHP